MEKTGNILKNQKRNFTEVINLYFQAIVKDPTILEIIEKTAHQRKGNFIGMLDGDIGDDCYKDLKREYYKNIS